MWNEEKLCGKDNLCPTWLRIWYQVSHVQPRILISSHYDCPTFIILSVIEVEPHEYDPEYRCIHPVVT